MKADQTAKVIEEGKQSKSFHEEPIGLPVSRKSVNDWSWRSIEDHYEIVNQVGEGTFR